MKNATLPVLDKPGAGLPFIQRVFLKAFIGPVISKRTPLPQCRADYERIVGKLLEKVAAVPAERRSVRVLIGPLAGLEDSSRYWSLNEVLEHLMITAPKMEAVILSLATGKIPSGVADTATLKPRGENHDTVDEFRTYAPGLLGRIDERLRAPGMDIGSPLSFRHPWFGPFTARQWYWVLGSHAGVHYRQAKKIIAGLVP